MQLSRPNRFLRFAECRNSRKTGLFEKIRCGLFRGGKLGGQNVEVGQTEF